MADKTVDELEIDSFTIFSDAIERGEITKKDARLEANDG